MMPVENKKSLLQMGLLFLLLVVTSSGCFKIPPTPAPEGLAFKSPHGRYVIAQGEEKGWVLSQEPGFSECGWFNVQTMINGKVALESCNGRYVTAPDSDGSREEVMLVQETELGECGQFDMYKLGEDRVAFKTCAGNFWTAGDGGWPGELAWSIVAETDTMEDWEIFIEQEEPEQPLPLPVIATFDACNDEGRMRPVTPPDSSLAVSYLPETGRGCVASLEYDVAEWGAFLFELRGADLTLYDELVFDVRADDPAGIPGQIKVELKRESNEEVSILYVFDITTDWQTKRLRLGDFEGSLTSWTSMEELLFTFGPDESGSMDLDNVALR